MTDNKIIKISNPYQNLNHDNYIYTTKIIHLERSQKVSEKKNVKNDITQSYQLLKFTRKFRIKIVKISFSYEFVKTPLRGRAKFVKMPIWRSSSVG